MQMNALVYPMAAMVLFTFIVLMAMFRSRVQAVRKGEVASYYFKTYQGEAEPDSSLKLSQHFSNMLEAPTLFYVACVAAMVLNEAALLFYLLAWLYVILRVLHAYIHTGRNRLRSRVRVYFASWIVLLFMWVDLVIKVAIQS
jgi:hypothetical protein